MGNQLGAPAAVQPAESLAADLPNVVFKESLGELEPGPAHDLARGATPSCPPICAGGGRFFKSALCVHDDGGLVVVKVGGGGGGRAPHTPMQLSAHPWSPTGLMDCFHGANRTTWGGGCWIASPAEGLALCACRCTPSGQACPTCGPMRTGSQRSGAAAAAAGRRAHGRPAEGQAGPAAAAA